MTQKKNRDDITQDFFDSQIGIDIVRDGPPKIAYLANLKTSKIIDDDLVERNVLLLYFIEQNGEWFKAYIKYDPYFYISCPLNLIKEIISYLEKKFEGKISSIDIIDKVDIEMLNHLSGKMNKFLKLNFRTINDLVMVRNTIRPFVERKKAKEKEMSLNEALFSTNETKKYTDYLDAINDIREYDIPYHTRVCIDLDIRMSYWYQLKFQNSFISSIVCQKQMVERPDFRIMAFDIETTKLPLKFPDSKIDNIMMISINIDGASFLITNRSIISKDVLDFEFSPKKEYESQIKVFNEPTERSLLMKFFNLIKTTKPFILTSYNGDMFDWPFIEARSLANNLSLEEEISVRNEDGEYFGRFLTHLDCFYWVDRDSYLPQGSHGLKAVCKAKLGYDPIEVDPEMMVPMARNDPQQLSEYSVSDAVATYHLYKKHIHDFIFALGTIIPMNADEVLRKGSGTLCENLLMAEAFKRNIIFPNKKKENFEKFHQGHLLDNETYIGGRVEGLTSGVYRSDLPTNFSLEPKAYQQLIGKLDKLLEFVCQVENGVSVEEVANITEVKGQITEKLQAFADLKGLPSYEYKPLVYHLDVAAMYPNIILTNRLQPVSVVDDKICSGCLFNLPENNCKKVLEWQWKGDYFPLSRSEYENVKYQLEYEYNSKISIDNKNFYDLPLDVQVNAIKKRVRLYSQKTYKKQHESKVELKENTICMRENSFYVDTVRSFRDRRYEFKNLVKVHKNNENDFTQKKDYTKAQESKDLVCLYESLQLAHKVILNSFYGYVMRRGARWYSMEMAAMVTDMGSNIIKDAKSLVDLIGKPLELDTDGIWCLLPSGFPENYSLKLKSNKTLKFSYPCSILNILIYEKYLNDQYQVLVDPTLLKYETQREMSIFFEIDGPYKAMFLPAAREEGKQLKKRYAVYNLNGTLAEIKGFELKRRGELKLIKIFQTQIFSEFLSGASLTECYESCGLVAQRWMDILLNKGYGLDDEELIDYICESRVLSKSLGEYDAQKGVAITAAKRLSEFLGEEIVQGKGLNCQFIISRKPAGSPVNERSIPISIFSTEEGVRRRFLKKWLKESEIKNDDIREIIDWEYYKERLGNSIQKIVVIPAALQKVKNPIPCVPYPEWLNKIVRDLDSNFQQKKLENYFSKTTNIIRPDSVRIRNENEVTLTNSRNKTPDGKIPKTPIKKANLTNGQSESKTIGNEINKKDIEGNFKEWIKDQKKIWLDQRKNKELLGTTPISGVRGYLFSTEQLILNSVWHVLQIQPTDRKGIFKLWFYTENKSINNVTIKIPRIIYINSKEVQRGAEMFHLVKKKLPRERKNFNLYEVRVDEEDYLKKYNSFDFFLTNPVIEGVYESKIPLNFAFLSQYGCLIKLQKASKNKSLNTVFAPEEFQSLFNYEKPYLMDFDCNKTFISQITLKDKTIWGLFNPIQGLFDFILVHKNIDVANYSSIVREVLKSDPNFHNFAAPKIRIHNLESNELAIVFLEKALQSLKENVRNPTLLIIQSGFSANKLQSIGLRHLLNEFPYLILPEVPSDSLNYSVLDWQKKGIRALCESYISMPELLKSLMEFCRYSHIPFCNLEGDRLLFVIDVFYSRILKAANCISWYSDSHKPDIGGAREDDLRNQIPTDYIYSEIVKPSLYNHYCVEVDIELLALNTICVSDELKNIDKEASKLVETKNNAQNNNEGESVDEVMMTKTAFKYVKIMVMGWLDDVVKANSSFADVLIQNIHRWVCQESSKLYDPFLRKMLGKLMKKVFGYLLNRLKSLGAQIVFANVNKIIISTGKMTFPEAENYANFVLKTIVSYPLFSYLNLKTTKYWKVLLFKDLYNYGGMIEGESKIKMIFNIGDYLPPKIEQYFSVAIGEYIYKLYSYRQKLVNREEITETIIHQADLEEKMVVYSKKYIQEACTVKFFNLIPEMIKLYRNYRVINSIKSLIKHTKKIEKEKTKELEALEENKIVVESAEIDSVISHYEEDEEEENKKQRFLERRNEMLEEWEFPQVIGRVYKCEDLILEFINSVFHVLGLDENIYEELILLKRNCLKFLQISDFSQEAIYQEPVKKITIEEVICDVCFSVGDIDLFRSKNTQTPKRWVCPNCENPFDMSYIENKLVQFIKINLALYQIQDLYCSKCKLVNEDLLSRMCKCSGKFTLSINEFSNPLVFNYTETIQNLKELAIKHDFNILLAILESLQTK